VNKDRWSVGSSFCAASRRSHKETCSGCMVSLRDLLVGGRGFDECSGDRGDEFRGCEVVRKNGVVQ
jgi:hypothetical protein